MQSLRKHHSKLKENIIKYIISRHTWPESVREKEVKFPFIAQGICLCAFAWEL